MSLRPKLKLDWATHKAAKYAVEHWHYLKTMPASKVVKVGVWEGEKFIGVVLFSRGANANLLTPFGLKQTDGCELTRIALTDHINPVSRIVAIAVRFLKKYSEGTRLIVSYADTGQNHHGGIYQAGNWLYAGITAANDKHYMVFGKKQHPRSVGAKYGTRSLPALREKGIKVELCEPEPKHKYLMALDKEIKKQIEHLRQPYPKREKQAMDEHPSSQRRGSTDLHAPNL